MATGIAASRPVGAGADINNHGLLGPAETSLLTDQYELTMAASYLARGERARRLRAVRPAPPASPRLAARGGHRTRPELVDSMRFSRRKLDSLRSLGFAPALLDYLAGFRFSGSVDAMPGGTVAFAGEPLLRVTAPRIETQLVETLLLSGHPMRCDLELPGVRSPAATER
jgi:nicotinate phosphoribosyltransferase